MGPSLGFGRVGNLVVCVSEGGWGVWSGAMTYNGWSKGLSAACEGTALEK